MPVYDDDKALESLTAAPKAKAEANPLPSAIPPEAI